MPLITSWALSVKKLENLFEILCLQSSIVYAAVNLSWYNSAIMLAHVREAHEFYVMDVQLWNDLIDSRFHDCSPPSLYRASVGSCCSLYVSMQSLSSGNTPYLSGIITRSTVLPVSSNASSRIGQSS